MLGNVIQPRDPNTASAEFSTTIVYKQGKSYDSEKCWQKFTAFATLYVHASLRALPYA